ncbi:hypothetical protein O6H91_12G060200 [Diphasiastrum complanatum]|uniref:Uncharacterized protein n=3 Tax=Diphasiastrum complanatum TaxID=34168 RepID=A0ACC2C2D5_DIPCM|nr:hypothetical protein O6H91_12G060200 [Diphasiastrum complanatum]KAJ7536218.1 hypothetical protein O6H91_12G060200 [Diphasiastrum complanatum]KAJ7536219.1 hypothetical protein O6H91_12G060200 [Diphasiastrum complanatum]
MSCNGCRVLRKGCSQKCVLRSCLQWIDGAEAQGHATIFLAKFFGRAGLMSFISAVPEKQRPALFKSLLYEACGRTVNPIYGAVGLLASGNWQVCHAAVEMVLRRGFISLRSSETAAATSGLEAPASGSSPQIQSISSELIGDVGIDLDLSLCSYNVVPCQKNGSGVAQSHFPSCNSLSSDGSVTSLDKAEFSVSCTPSGMDAHPCEFMRVLKQDSTGGYCSAQQPGKYIP